MKTTLMAFDGDFPELCDVKLSCGHFAHVWRDDSQEPKLSTLIEHPDDLIWCVHCTSGFQMDMELQAKIYANKEPK